MMRDMLLIPFGLGHGSHSNKYLKYKLYLHTYVTVIW